MSALPRYKSEHLPHRGQCSVYVFNTVDCDARSHGDNSSYGIVVLMGYIGFSTPKRLISPIWVFLFRLHFRKVGSVTFTRVCSYQPVNHYRSSSCELDMRASLFLVVKSAFFWGVLFANIRLMITLGFYWKHGGHQHVTYQCLQSPSRRGIRHGLSGSE